MPAPLAVSRAPASSSWEPLGETFYRRYELYSMQWSLSDLSDYVIAGARWGGPLAVMRDDRKPVLLARGQQHSIGKPRISIYSSAGGLIQTIQWDSQTRIVSLGWTLSESLVVLTQDGTYRIYSLSTTSSTPVYKQHSLGSEAQEAGVLEARIYEEGMVVLLGSLTFIEVKGWQRSGSDGSGGGRVVPLAQTGLTQEPDCWTVITPEVSQSRGVEVLFGTGSSIIRLDEGEAIDQRITRGPFASITPSPNGRFLALVSGTPDGSSQLWVASSDFSRSLSEFDLKGQGDSGPPSKVAWCGNNTVVVTWEKTVVMVGPFGETLKYFYTDPVYVIGEIDGTRIVSSDSCEFLQIVPQSSQEVFRPGSAHPAAILFEAAEQFEKKSPKADEYIRNIKAELTVAVDTCIDAAGREYEVYWQKKLLKAASFGKSFLDMYDPAAFVKMTQVLRVVNAARYYEIGIPITFDQYSAYSASSLIARLIARSQYLLSLRISSFLGLSSAPVLKEWAQSKISLSKGGEDDRAENEICKEIVKTLRGQTDISCADIARSAWALGKTSLATKLLDYEPRSSKQVPLLLSMREDNLALVKAIESEDPNLVYDVLLHLKRSHALGDFFRFVHNKPDAAALLQVFAKENDVELLRDFYYQDDRRQETACLALEESLGLQDFGEKVAKVREAMKSFAEDKDCTFEAKMVDDQIKLLALQQSLQQETPTTKFVGISINETMRACLVAGNPKKADKIRSDFKVPDKRFWYVKMKALIEIRDWDALDAFARVKKSPIGYEPWVEQLLATGSQRQAVVYVARCEQRNKVDLYVKCGEWIMAGQECARRGDKTRLHELCQRSPNAVIAAQLDQLMDEMTSA